jgi:hypothetical protein
VPREPVKADGQIAIVTAVDDQLQQTIGRDVSFKDCHGVDQLFRRREIRLSESAGDFLRCSRGKSIRIADGPDVAVSGLANRPRVPG